MDSKQSNVLSVGPLSIFFMLLSDEMSTLETLAFTIHIGSRPTIFIFRFVIVILHFDSKAKLHSAN